MSPHSDLRPTADLLPSLNSDTLELPGRAWVPMPTLPVGSAASRGDDQLITPRLIYRALMHWWAIAVPVAVLLAVGSSAAIWFTFQPRYRAAAILQIQDRASTLVPEWTEDGNLSEKASMRFVQTQVELLRSPLVLGPLLSQPEIARIPGVSAADDPLATIVRALRVEAIEDSELYSVSCTWNEPEPAALLVNSALESYFRLRAEHEAARSQRVVELLDQEKELRAEAVQRLREKMRALGKEILGQELAVESPSGESRPPLRSLEKLQVDLAEAEVKRRVLEAQLKAAEEGEGPTVPAAFVEEAVLQNSEIQEARILINQKRAMLHRIESAAVQGRADGSYQRLEREIAQLERSLEEATRRARVRTTDNMKAMAGLKRKDDVQKLEDDLNSQKVHEQILRERLADEIKTMEATSGKSLELEFLRAELAREGKVFEMIAERSTALKTQMKAPERVTLLERAEPPLQPLERLPYRELFLGILASLAAPFGLAVLYEILVRPISDSEQLGQGTRLSVVAEVAHLPTRARQGGRIVPARLAAFSVFEESVESLRTALLHNESNSSVQVIAVASAVPREGKTSIASQLSVSLARSANVLTLIIDGDMRSPDIHRIFGVPAEPGLAEVLRGQCSLDEAIRTDWHERLHILPAGMLTTSPHELLGAGAFGEILQALRERYRYIVIDTPPVLSASEALVMAREADGTLLCAMRNRSREDWVRRASDRLQNLGISILGSVLSAVPTKEYTYRYGRYSDLRLPK